MGSMSRKFLGLIVNEHTPGFKTLRCIDLTLQKLFYDAPPPAAAPDGDGGARDAAATSRRPPPPPASSETTIGRLGLHGPSFTFRPGDADASGQWGMHCFPLRDRSVVCVDRSGLAMAFDGEARVVGTISEAGRSIRGGAKRTPLSLPSFSTVEVPTSHQGPSDCDEAIFVMERFPEPEEKRTTKSRQFEAFFKINDSGHWIRRLLPPPPFVARRAGGDQDQGGGGQSVEITAYAVVGLGSRAPVCVRDDGTYYFDGGSCICVSAAGAGTYCMDTEPNHRWTKAGGWTLPFAGKVEYVPDLQLWFGFSAGDESRRLAAADLSGMGSRKMAASEEPPQLVGTWQELDPPEDWKECRDPQMVNLGSGRFCIARFFKTTSDGPSSSSDDGDTGEDFAVLTGVELVPCLDDDSEAKGGKGKVMKLRMIRHKSSRLHGGGTIDTVF